MKKEKVLSAIVVLLINVFLPLAAPTQVLPADQVPDVVKEGLRAKFPTAKRVEWKLKSDKNYEAEFTLKRTEIAAKFDGAGKWLETESAISWSKVPKIVRDTVAKRFKGYKTVESQSVQRWNEQQLIYELHLENAKEIVKAQFSKDGAVLNQSTKPKSGKDTQAAIAADGKVKLVIGW
ncbi:MAG TPA: PepSY-like domain-containing protein [Candidatus Binatia bacterium]|jgi:hypothetical protein|nr:PepSY-like domain-containing protein [Candidatus Binatia bacterium]